MSQPTKATPRAILQGIEDNSRRTPPVVPEQIPTHLPLVYLFTERGPSEPQVVVGSSLTATYGARSLDYLGPFANHQTVLARVINAAGNALMVKRLKPADAATGLLRLCVEVIREDLPIYLRNADGSYQLDANGDKQQDGARTTVGWKLAWRLNPAQVTGAFGQALVGAAGNMSEANGDSSIAGATSVIYPIADLEVANWGDYGNRVGLRISAPSTKSTQPLNINLVKQVKSFLYRFSVIERPVDAATPNLVGSIFGETQLDLALADGIVNPRLGTQLSAEDVLIDRYQDLDTVGQTPQYGPFGQIKVYQDQIDTLLDLLVNGDDDATNPAEGEAAFDVESTWRESALAFSDAANIHLLNFLTGKDVNGAPYTNFTIVTSGASAGLNLTSSTNLYASGGADGDISEGNFDKLVRNEANNFGAAGFDTMLDRAKYPCSIVYDSGFSMDTKEALLVPMSRRPDMATILSTQELGYWMNEGEVNEEWVVKGPNTAAEESANASALKAAAELYPESQVYGTPVCRAAIIGHCGKLINSQWKKTLPLTIDVADKLAKYMGAGNGRWTSTARFDEAPLNQVTMFKDVNETYKQDTVYDNDWSSGLVWVQNFDRQRLFYPAFQTVYSDDTSVLNSLITMLACVELEKVADRVWRLLTGNTRLTNGQFIERSDALIVENTQGRFDGRFTIVPETIFTENDAIRGYSWTCTIKIYANNMRTVGTMTIQANRQSDLEG